MTLSKIPGPRKAFLGESSLEKLPATLLKIGIYHWYFQWEIIHLVRTQNFPKKLTTFVYQGVRNVSFFGNFAYVLNEWSLSDIWNFSGELVFGTHEQLLLKLPKNRTEKLLNFNPFYNTAGLFLSPPESIRRSLVFLCF